MTATLGQMIRSTRIDGLGFVIALHESLRFSGCIGFIQCLHDFLWSSYRQDQYLLGVDPGTPGSLECVLAKPTVLSSWLPPTNFSGLL